MRKVLSILANSTAAHDRQIYMPKFTALVHIDEASKKAEDTLRSVAIANDLLVILDPDDKPLRRLVRKVRGRIKTTIPGVSPGAYAMDSYHDWVLVLRPGEVLDEQCAEALKDWKKQKEDDEPGHRVRILRNGNPVETLRLVNRLKINWTGELPPESKVIPLMTAPIKQAA
jgi:hypothetical protein